MEDRAIRWEKLMLYIEEVLEMWVQVQSMYLYLEPIFSFEDITKNLGVETEKFGTVDRSWRDIMNQVKEDPLVINIDRIPNLLGNLKKITNLFSHK